MRLAVIDCGTNTFNLIIVSVGEGKQYSRVYNNRVAVKLGEGAINKGYIADAPFERAIKAIESFSQDIQEYQVDIIKAFATSAIRDASNGHDLVEKVKQKFGITLSIIDGNREAELIYLGVKEAVSLKESASLIMDIGGGSTEFIIANKKEVLWKQSFQVGAARLLEKFTPSNPILQSEIDTIYNHLQIQLKPLIVAFQKYGAAELVGSSGAFDSIIEMIEGELNGEHFSLEKTEYEVTLDNYLKISELVIKSDIGERKKIKLMRKRLSAYAF